VPALPWAPFFLAADKGYFKELGLDVQLEPIQSSNDAVIQLAAGNYDVAAGGANVGFWNAIQRGIKVSVAAPLHPEGSRQATPLLVSKAAYDAGKIRRVADLKGKKVAVNGRGAAIEYWLERALNTGGLSISEVDVQVVAFPDVAAALSNGAIDAAVATEPFPTLAEDKGLVVRLADNFVANFQVTMVYFNVDFAQKHADTATKVITGFLKGCRDLQAGGWQDETNSRIIEKYTKVAADVIRRAASAQCDPNGRFQEADFMQLQNYFIKGGALTYSKPIEFKTLVDQTYVQNALKALGPYKP
jgi:NitT/TauT family transport system substrate-binding protein